MLFYSSQKTIFILCLRAGNSLFEMPRMILFIEFQKEVQGGFRLNVARKSSFYVSPFLEGLPDLERSFLSNETGQSSLS